MSTQTVYLQVFQNLISSDSENYNENTFILSNDYTASNVGNVTIPVGDSYTSLPFGIVTQTTFVKIITDNVCSIKLNGGTEEFTNISSFISGGQFNEIEIKNESEYVANINFEFYGTA